MLHHFKTRDLSEFTPNNVPETEYTQDIKAESKSWLADLFEMALLEEVWPFGIDIIKYQDIESYVAMRTPDSADRWETKRDRVVTTLREVGFMKYRKPGRARRTIKIDGHEQSLWLKPGADVGALYNTDVEDIKEMLAKYVNPNEEDFAD